MKTDRLVHSHQTLKKDVRGNNLDVYEGHLRGNLGVIGFEGYMRDKGEGCLAIELRSTGRASQREAIGHWKTLPI